MKPDAPITAAEPSPPMVAPEHSPTADSSRLTGTWVKRLSCATVSISGLSQLSGRLATSFTPQSASWSAMRFAVSPLFDDVPVSLTSDPDFDRKSLAFSLCAVESAGVARPSAAPVPVLRFRKSDGEDAMKELIKQYLDDGVSRRKLMTGL